MIPKQNDPQQHSLDYKDTCCEAQFDGNFELGAKKNIIITVYFKLRTKHIISSLCF